jgi:hypothetical protein
MGMYVLVEWLPVFGGSLYYPAYIIGAFAIGVLMGWLVEMPVLRLRDRLYPTRSRAAELVAV